MRSHDRQCPSSASDSSDPAEHRRLDRARRVLMKHDPEFQQFVEDTRAKEEQERLVTRGRSLAIALAPALEAAMGGRIDA